MKKAIRSEKLLAFVARAELPESAPPPEKIPSKDLVLTALVICYQEGLSGEQTVKALEECGVTAEEQMNALNRLTRYYAERN